MLRAGGLSFAVLALMAVAVLGAWVVLAVRVVVFPLLLALFPAALLAPGVRWLSLHGLRRSLATLLILVTSFVVVGLAVAVMVPQVIEQFGPLSVALRSGVTRLEAFLASGRYGTLLNQVIQTLRSPIGADQRLWVGLIGAVHTSVEVVVGGVLGLVALFFYLRDGEAIAVWFRDLWPVHLRGDVEQVDGLIWSTITHYVRGQLVVGTSNAVLVGFAMWLLGVPLVLPTMLLVFVGGFFPLVGVTVAGTVAVLVALASGGPGTALVMLSVLLVVQQLEGHVVAPFVHGRFVRLHPLAVIVALALGIVLLGVVGAFLAVPVTASATRVATYLRRSPGTQVSPALLAARGGEKMPHAVRDASTRLTPGGINPARRPM